MSLLKCELCERAFNSVGAKLCPACADEIDKSYIKVRRYLYQNPAKKSFASVMEATEVSEKVLSYLIDKGRIIIDATTASRGKKCIACGSLTEGANLCDRCKAKLISEKLLTNKFPTIKTEVNKSDNTASINKNIVKLKRGEKDEN
jgi:predicted amidophosphoribosyltransferase